MKSITLSDHAADQADTAATARATSYAAKKTAHDQKIERHNAKSVDLRLHSKAAFRDRRWFAWLLSFLPRMGHAMTSMPPPPVMESAGRDEIVWNAGSDGEKRVDQTLAAILSDEWTLISGYRNSGGEIDKLLIGPNGILAIEIKFINGLISCDGDTWWRDKYDRYGNLVESNLPIADRKGRGPSMQVNSAANRLDFFLNQRGPAPRVARAVVLSHDSSILGEIKNTTVDIITTIDKLTYNGIQQVLNSPSIDVSRIIDLIKKDHAFHARPRPKRDPGRAATPQR